MTEQTVYHPRNTTSQGYSDEEAMYATKQNMQQQPVESTTYTAPTDHGSDVYKYTTSSHEMRDSPVVDGRVISEQHIERTIRIPKRIIREEIVEEDYTIRETIVEIAKPITSEKIVEVPEVSYKETIKEVVEHVIEEKIKEVPKIEYCERIIEVPKIITKEKIIHKPQIEYCDVVTERVVEIPEIHQNVILKEVEVPTYVDDKGQAVEQPTLDIERKIPVPVEAVTTFEYQLAQLRPRRTKIQYPILVPRFIPVPVPAESIEQSKLEEMQHVVASVNKLVAPQAMDLREIEQLTAKIRTKDFASCLPTQEEAQKVIREKWLTGQIQVNATDQPIELKLA